MKHLPETPTDHSVRQPLSAARVLRRGSSRAARLLELLLVQQGAAADARDAGGSIDIVIDDCVEPMPASPAMDPDERRIRIAFADFPREHPAWLPRSRLVDEVIHAEMGLNRMAPGGALRPEPLPIASAYGALWGALYAAAALRRRRVTGKGGEVEIALASGLLSVIGRKMVRFDDARLVDFLDGPNLPLAEIFQCADGRHVQNHGMYPHFAAIACRVFGRDEWADAAAAGIPSLPDEASVRLWRERFAAEFRKRPALAWEDAINAAGGSCTMCRTLDEWLAAPHARETGIVATATDTGAAVVGGPTAARPAIATSSPASSPEPSPRPSPSLGPAVRISSPSPPSPLPLQPSSPQPRRVARPDAGRAWRTPSGPDAALPLAGIRVVDFCIVLAGPAGGRTLAEFGADVIKIEAPHRHVSPSGWVDINRGKRSMVIDLKQAEGRDIARRLVLSADVVLQNLRRGRMDRLGLGYDEIRRERPDIVYASLNAFDFGGPWSDRPGWEHNAQAMTGMQVDRAEGGAPRPVPVATNDYMTGLLGAYGIMLALEERDRTGVGAHVTGSLTRSATFMQFEARAGAQAATRVLRCADGWVRVVVDDAWSAAAVDEASLAAIGRDDAAARLRSLGVCAVVERTMTEMADCGWLDEAGLRPAWDHPRWGPMQQGAARAARSDVPKRTGAAAPDRGEDTRAILAELGYGADEIDGLLRRGAVRDRMPVYPMREA